MPAFAPWHKGHPWALWDALWEALWAMHQLLRGNTEPEALAEYEGIDDKVQLRCAVSLMCLSGGGPPWEGWKGVEHLAPAKLLIPTSGFSREAWLMAMSLGALQPISTDLLWKAGSLQGHGAQGFD